MRDFLKTIGAILIVLLIGFILCLGPGTVIWGTIQEEVGLKEQQEKFPEGSVITLKNSNKEYIIIENHFKYYVNTDPFGEVTIISLEEGVKLKVNTKDIILKERDYGKTSNSP